MINRLTFFVFIILICTGCRFAGQHIKGNGHVSTENRSVPGSDNLHISGSMDVIIDSGASNIRVEADDNIIPYIVTEERNGALEIGMKNNVRITTHDPITVYITTPSISRISVGGSGNVSSKNKFWSKDKMTFNLGGSGTITLDINAPAVTSNIGGSGNISLSGETRDASVSIGGSGNYKGFDLKAESVHVSVGGSGNASVFSDGDLSVTIGGSGEVKYKGNAEVHKTISGSGSVEKVN